MTLNNLHDLFEHELKDIYAAEKTQLAMLEQMRNQAREETVKRAVESHVSETRAQIQRLDDAFRHLNLQPGNVTCPGAQGLAKEKHEFDQMNPVAELMDLYNVGAGIKGERYEISAYEGLLDLAEKLGLTDLAGPLQTSLGEEQAMLERLTEARKMMSAGKAKAQKRTDAATR